MSKRVLIVSIVLMSFLSMDLFARPSWHRRSKLRDDAPKVQIETRNIDAAAPVTAYPPIGEIDNSTAWASSVPGSPEVRILTLDDCIDMALDRNKRLTAAGYDIEAAKGDLMRSKAAFWPVMEYKYRMAPVPKDVDDAWNTFWRGDLTFFNSLHVGIGVPVMTFGRLHTAKRMAEGGVQAARLKLRSLQNETIHQVKKIYYGIQFANEMIKLLREAVNRLSKKIDEDAEHEIKEMDPYNTLRLKIFKEELAGRVAEAEQNRELAYEAMRIQLDLESDTEINLDSTHLRPLLHVMDELKHYIEVAMEHQTESKLMDIGVATKQKQYKLEQLELLPKAGFGFFADIGRSVGFVRGLQSTDDFNDPFNYTRAGLGLQLSGTLDFHGAIAKIRKAKAEYYKASYERLIARRGLSLEMKKAYLEATRMREQVMRAKRVESMSQQMVFLSKMNVDMGIGDETEYAEAVKLVLMSRGQYFKTVLDFNLALAGLEGKIGHEKFKELTSIPDIPEYEVFSGDSDDGYMLFEENSVDMEGIEDGDNL